MSDRTERVEELFEAVIEQAPEDREHFLNQACGDDTSLRNEVQTLVRHHEGAELSGFLDQRDAEGAEESVGEDGGRYVVVKKHAAGSLGEVLIALDKDFEREIALKRVLPAMSDDPLCRRRFDMEAKITGRLEHPGIVPVYSRGKTRDGEAFYAMKFIEGETMRAAIEQLHDPSQAKAKWNENLRALLRRFIDVCNAIDFAHSRGVVHRDIKPANVVLGKFGETMVVDWGIAKLVDAHDDSQLGAEETLHLREDPNATATRTGSYLGTPAYMSPEQATGKVREVGPWSDVFGLGAMLYHILTAKPPYVGRNTQETLVLASKGKWKFPRVMKVRRVPFGLQSICDKAMAKDQSERYTSAGILATDVENWLEDRPLIGHPDTVPEMIARYFRKHPMLAVVITLFLLADVPILINLFVGTDMEIESIMLWAVGTLALGIGAGQFLGIPSAILGGIVGLFREEGRWPYRILRGTQSGLVHGVISGSMIGSGLGIVYFGFEGSEMFTGVDGVTTVPEEALFISLCYFVAAGLGTLFLRAIRQRDRVLHLNLHLSLAVMLTWGLLLALDVPAGTSIRSDDSSFFSSLRSGEYSIKIQDIVTLCMQLTFLTMLFGYGIGGFVGLLLGIVRGRSLDRAIEGSRIGVFIFAGIGLVLALVLSL